MDLSTQWVCIWGGGIGVFLVDFSCMAGGFCFGCGVVTTLVGDFVVVTVVYVFVIGVGFDMI